MAGEEAAVTALQEGADDYLLKPFTVDQLRDTFSSIAT